MNREWIAQRIPHQGNMCLLDEVNAWSADHIECRATIGEVSNDEHSLRVVGKAGANRWKGIRPTVRGVAMNPVDHPHGGGEGRTGEGGIRVTPRGQMTKGYRTRSNKRTTSMIVSRRKK